MKELNCPCGRSATYNTCCERIHKDITLAKTAEDLMRSRYTAFALAMGNYLMKSHHSTTRPIEEQKEIEKWAKSVKWDCLEVLDSNLGSETDQQGTVEFKAYFFENRFGRTKRKHIHELSYFEKEEQHWVYVGEHKR